MKYEAGDLREDTRVEADPERPGRFYADISNAWNILYVFGGTTMATAVSAARAARSQPSFDLLSATGTFLAPVKAGKLTLDTRILRSGKGSEQISVELAQAAHAEPVGAQADGSAKPALHLVASFGPKRPNDITVVDVAFPDAPDPESIPEHIPKPGSSMLMIPYYHSVETRVVTKASSASSENGARWLGWLRFKKTPRQPDGLLDPLAYVAACDMVAPALRMARGRAAAPQMVVSLEISLHFYEQTDSEWLLQDAHIYHAGGGYLSGVVNLWDRRQRLVGHALQRAVLRPRAF
jgi:acyl-CoA thioesterase